MTLPLPSEQWANEVKAFDVSRVETLPSITIVGSGQTVHDGVRAFADRMKPDELIVVGHVYDHAARVRSFEILSDLIRA